MPKPKNKISNKQAVFVQEYLIDLNATQAAIRAGYSEKSGRAAGQVNLAKPFVQEAIQKALKDRSGRTQITQDRVLREIARIAFSDPRKFFDANGNLRPISELDEDAAAALAGFAVVRLVKRNEDGEMETENVIKVKFWDKNSALEKLAKHLNLLINKFELTGKDGGPVVLDCVSNDERAKRAIALLIEDADKELENGEGAEDTELNPVLG